MLNPNPSECWIYTEIQTSRREFQDLKKEVLYTTVPYNMILYVRLNFVGFDIPLHNLY